MRTIHRIALATMFCLSTTAALAANPAPTASPQQRQERMQKRADERFDKVDTNHDGAISHDEFMAQSEERFKKLDTNGDGKISKEERDALREKWQEKRAARRGGASAPATAPK